MTVSSSTNRVSFAGNGVTVAFAFSAPYRASSDLVVTLRNTTTLVETTQIEGTHYTVVGVANAGTGGFDSATVTMVTAPPTGTTLVINRAVPLTSSLDPNSGAALGAANLEGAIDRGMLAMQGLQEQIGRALLLPKTSPLSNLALPEPRAAVANNLMGVNATGDGFALFSSTTLAVGAVVSAFVSTLLDDANAQAFLTTLGFLKGSAVIDFASVADNVTATGGTTITVTGAVQGDFVILSSNGNIMTTAGAFLYGKVTSANTITAYLANDTGGAFDAASQTVNALVIPKALFGL